MRNIARANRISACETVAPSLSLSLSFSISVRVYLSASRFLYAETPVVEITRNCDVLLAIIAPVLEIALIRGRVKDRFQHDD